MPSATYTRALKKKLHREHRLRAARRQVAYIRLCQAECNTRDEMSRRHGDAIKALCDNGNLEQAATASAGAKRTANRYAELSKSWAEEIAATREPQSVAEVFEIKGRIKWFDASKGYGFITPDNGPADVLLHVSCLRAVGYETALEGARIACEVLRRPRGLQAFRILSMDVSTAFHPSQLPLRTHVQVTPESDWVRAMVKWYNRVRGFGFLTRGEGTPDIFVHMETVRRYGFTELRPDQFVQVRYGQGSKGCMAAEMRPDGQAVCWPSAI